MKTLLLLLLTTFQAQASITVDCGFQRKSSEDKLERFFLLSTENSSFYGQAGSDWHLYDFLGDEVLKGELSENESGNLEIFLPNYFAPSPHTMGTIYEIERPYGQTMVGALQRQVGGFTGGTITARFECSVHTH